MAEMLLVQVMVKRKYTNADRKELRESLSNAIALLAKVSKKIPIKSPRQKSILKLSNSCTGMAESMPRGTEPKTERLLNRVRKFVKDQVSEREKWGFKKHV